MNREGISVASINYRFKEKDKSRFEGEDPLYPAIYYDAARALQFLRYHATKYNLDKIHFAAQGSSAGGIILLWLGLHPDLAQTDHKDPILRESSRLQVLAPRNCLTTVHYPSILKLYGVKTLNKNREEGPVQPTGQGEPLTAKHLRLSLDASPIIHVTPDDPPIYLQYGGRNQPVDEATLWGIWVHHPMSGIKLKEAMDELGVECNLIYSGGPPVREYESLSLSRDHFGEWSNSRNGIPNDHVSESAAGRRRHV